MVILVAEGATYYQQILDILEKYGSFGPLLAIFLPMSESFLPFLPLFAFVFANAAAYGFWLGFIYSWLGSVAGTMMVFLIIRKYGRTRFFRILNRHPKVKVLTSWMDKRGFGSVFLIFCFPFTPSALINAVAALSKLPVLDFLLALTLGRFVMIGSISFIGYDIGAFFTSPPRTIAVLLVIAVLWFVGKQVEKRLGVK